MKGHKILILMGHWDILTKNLIYIMYTISFDFPGGSDLKSLPTMWETWIRSLGQKDPLEKEMATHSSVLAWRIPGTGSLVGCRLWGRTESDMTEATQQQQQQQSPY